MMKLNLLLQTASLSLILIGSNALGTAQPATACVQVIPVDGQAIEFVTPTSQADFMGAKERRDVDHGDHWVKRVRGMTPLFLGALVSHLQRTNPVLPGMDKLESSKFIRKMMLSFWEKVTSEVVYKKVVKVHTIRPATEELVHLMPLGVVTPEHDSIHTVLLPHEYFETFLSEYLAQEFNGNNAYAQAHAVMNQLFPGEMRVSLAYELLPPPTPPVETVSAVVKPTEPEATAAPETNNESSSLSH